MASSGPEREEGGGESACWLDGVCPDCGAFVGERSDCPRCDTASGRV